MASYNSAILVGNLGRDPEVRETKSGAKVTNFSIATSRKWTDKGTGEAKEQTTWHNITCFGKLADITAQYLKKGSSVFVQGEMRVDEYEKDGVKKYKNYIAADTVQFLDKKGDDTAQTARPFNYAPGADNSDAIPF